MYNIYIHILYINCLKPLPDVCWFAAGGYRWNLTYTVTVSYRRVYIIIYIWATVNIWYIAPSHQFLKSAECIIVFQVVVYKQRLSFFEECIIVFQAPAQFPKNKDVSNTTLH